MIKNKILLLLLPSIFLFSCSSETEQVNLSFATGGVSGTYYPYGGVLAQEFNSNVEGLNVNVQSTGASVENIRLLNRNEADLAVVQNDVLDYAYNGIILFEDERIENIRTIATLYPETIQILAKPEITSVEELRGRRVSVGAIGSGTESNVRQILNAYDISFDDIEVEHLSFNASSDAYKDNKIDAFFVTAGVPTPAVSELALVNQLNIIPIDQDKIDTIESSYGYYTAITIPAGTYQDIDENINTLAVRATLIAREDLPEDTVYNIVKTMFENKDSIATGHSKGELLDANEAVKGASIPFHPGARRYYEEAGAL